MSKELAIEVIKKMVKKSGTKNWENTTTPEEFSYSNKNLGAQIIANGAQSRIIICNSTYYLTKEETQDLLAPICGLENFIEQGIKNPIALSAK
jgi:hypothetical protein